VGKRKRLLPEATKLVLFRNAANELPCNVLQAVGRMTWIAEVEDDVADMTKSLVLRIKQSREGGIEGRVKGKIDADRFVDLVNQSTVDGAVDAKEAVLMSLVWDLSVSVLMAQCWRVVGHNSRSQRSCVRSQQKDAQTAPSRHQA